MPRGERRLEEESSLAKICEERRPENLNALKLDGGAGDAGEKSLLGVF